jgi:hypothetical protein
LQIVALDIETMKLPNETKQLPVLITLAYFDDEILIKKYFLINIHDIRSNGYDYAAANM